MASSGGPGQNGHSEPPNFTTRLSIDGSRSSTGKDPSLERRKKLGKELCEAAAEGDLQLVRGTNMHIAALTYSV
jgi:hypothetical protein